MQRVQTLHKTFTQMYMYMYVTLTFPQQQDPECSHSVWKEVIFFDKLTKEPQSEKKKKTICVCVCGGGGGGGA